MREYKIGEVASLYGISHDQLRLYDKMGLVKALVNPENGYRSYQSYDLQKLELVLIAKEIGIPLKDIEPMLAGQSMTALRQGIAKQLEVIAEKQKKLEDLQQASQQFLNKLEGFTDQEGKVNKADIVTLDLSIYQIAPSELYAIFDKEKRSFTSFLDLEEWEIYDSSKTGEQDLVSGVQIDELYLKQKLKGDFYKVTFSGTVEALEENINRLRLTHGGPVYLQHLFRFPRQDREVFYYCNLYYKVEGD